MMIGAKPNEFLNKLDNEEKNINEAIEYENERLEGLKLQLNLHLQQFNATNEEVSTEIKRIQDIINSFSEDVYSELISLKSPSIAVMHILEDILLIFGHKNKSYRSFKVRFI